MDTYADWHYQKPEVRESTNTTTAVLDEGCEVDQIEHWEDRQDIRVRNPKSSLLVPVGYVNERGERRVIVPQYMIDDIDSIHSDELPEYVDQSFGQFAFADPELAAMADAAEKEHAAMAWSSSGLPSNSWQASMTPGDTFTSTTRTTNALPIFSLTTSHLKTAMYNNSLTPNWEDTPSNLAYNAGIWASNEVSGTGYAAGGAGDGTSGSSGTFSTPTFTASGGTLSFNASNAVWGATTPFSTIANAYGCIVYDNSGPGPGGSKSIVVGIWFGGTAFFTSAGTFTIQWGSSIWAWGNLG